jgi:hypothetical protein
LPRRLPPGGSDILLETSENEKLNLVLKVIFGEIYENFPNGFQRVMPQVGPLSLQLVMLTCSWSASFNSYKDPGLKHAGMMRSGEGRGYSLSRHADTLLVSIFQLFYKDPDLKHVGMTAKEENATLPFNAPRS